MKTLINKYKTFIKYIFSAGISFFIDLTLFTIFSYLFKLSIGSYGIISGTILARVISSLINYNLNRNKVFETKDGKTIDKATFTKYVTLVIVQMLVSSFSVFGLYNLTKINETLIKIPVECILFIINYFVQKKFIFNKKKIKIPSDLYKVLFVILGMIASFAFLVELNTKEIIDLARRDTDLITYLILSAFFIKFYKDNLLNTKRRMPFKILAIILSFLLILGYSFDVTDSGVLVYGNIIFFVISVLKFIGIFPFFEIVLNKVYDFWVSKREINTKENRVTKLFEKNPFWFSVIVMLICFLPYIIAYYPAILSPDPVNQIKEVMGLHTRYMDSVVFIDENVTITGFNPVLHTLLLGNCFKIGVNIGNVNFGLFLYTLLQITFMVLVLAYSIYYIKRNGVSNRMCLVVLAIYSLVPIFPFYALSTNKDTIFSLLVLLFVLKVHSLIKYDFNFKDMLILSLICIFMFLFRNNGIYTVFLTLPFCIWFLKEKRLLITCTLLITFLSYSCYNKVILPYFKITPTSIREVLSIPFQQTAALIKHEEDLISDEDKQVISSILDIDVIRNEYNPELSDKVKNTFNKDYKEEDLNSYFEVWLKYLKERPLIYVEATINNVYGYFYPNTCRWYLYHNYNSKLKEVGYDYHFNRLSSLRDALYSYGAAFQYTPILGAMVNIGFAVWIYFYLVCILIVNKNKKYILMLLPALSLILVCVASPANAYFRYALPYIMALPTTILLLYQSRKSFPN